MKLGAEILVRIPNTAATRAVVADLANIAFDRGSPGRSHVEREAWRLVAAQMKIAIAPEQLDEDAFYDPLRER